MCARKYRHAQNVQVINERMQTSETGTPLYTRAHRQTDRRVRVAGTGVSRRRVHLHAGYRQWNLSLAWMERRNVTVVRWAHHHMNGNAQMQPLDAFGVSLWCVSNVECRRLRHLGVIAFGVSRPVPHRCCGFPNPLRY